MPTQSEYQTPDQRQRSWRTIGTGLGALAGGLSGGLVTPHITGHEHPFLGGAMGALEGGIAGGALGHALGGDLHKTLPRWGARAGMVNGALLGAAAPLAAGWMGGSMLGHGVGGAVDTASEKVLGADAADTHGREAAGVAGGLGGAALMAPHALWTAPAGALVGGALGAVGGRHAATSVSSMTSERRRVIDAIHTLPLAQAHALVTTLHRQGADNDMLSQARYEYNLRRQNTLQSGLKTSAFTDFSQHIGPTHAPQWKRLGGVVGAGLGLGLGALAPTLMPHAGHFIGDSAGKVWVDNATDSGRITPETKQTLVDYGEPAAKALGGAGALELTGRAFTSPWLMPAYMAASGGAGYWAGKSVGELADHATGHDKQMADKFRGMHPVDAHLYAKAVQRAGLEDPRDIAGLARAHEARRLGVQEQARSELLGQTNAARMGLKFSAYLGGFDPLKNPETNPYQPRSHMLPYSLGGALAGGLLGAGLLHHDPLLPDAIQQHFNPDPNRALEQQGVDRMQDTITELENKPALQDPAAAANRQANLEALKAQHARMSESLAGHHPSFYDRPNWKTTATLGGGIVGAGAGAVAGAGASALQSAVERNLPVNRGARDLGAAVPLAGANEITRATERGVSGNRLRGMTEAQGLRDASMHDFALAHHALAARGLRP